MRAPPPAFPRNATEPLEQRRLRAAFAPDVTFGAAGFADLAVGTVVFCRQMTGGKILFVANTVDHSNVAIGRLNSNGSLDTSFGNGGITTSLTAVSYYDVHTAALQPDGKIVVMGYRDSGLFVARFNADGSADSSFGNNGLTDPIPSHQNGTIDANGITGLAIQSTGRIIAAGADELSLQDHNAHFGVLVGFTATGALDTTFGQNGEALMNFEDGRPQAIAVTQGDRIIVVGKTPAAFIARHNADGTVDSSFAGGAGQLLVELPNVNDEFNSIAMLPGGSVLVGGGTYGDNVGSFRNPVYIGVPALVKVTAAGALDTSFAGGDGIFLGEVGTGPYNSGELKRLFTAITTDADDNILAAARREPTASAGRGKLILYRLTSAGELDPTFAPSGKLETANEFYPSAITMQSDGRILLGGADANSGSIVRVGVPAPVQLGGNGTLYVLGTDGADVVTFTQNNADVVLTLNGQDYSYTVAEVLALDIDTAGGSDVITVSVGINTAIRPGAGNDLVVTSTGNDTIIEPATGTGRDTIRSSDGNDSIFSGDGDDRIIAGSGQMTITTGDGDDTVTLGAGHSLINLDAGNDRIDTALQARTTINGGTGNDTINTAGSVFIFAGVYKDKSRLPDDDDITVQGGPVFVRTEGGNNRVIVNGARDTSIGCGPGNDLVITGSGRDHIDLMGGDDNVYSNGGDDVIMQLGGSNLIYTGSGNDHVYSGFTGPLAPDTIYTAGGNDYIRVDTGGFIDAGSGNDTIDARENLGVPNPSPPVTVHGNSGNDHIIGSGSNDYLYGGEGDDTIDGFTGSNKIFGGDGNDCLRGGGGNDLIIGGAGQDTFLGNNGNDRIWANDGEHDLCNGGDGLDRYDADILDELIRMEAPM